MRRRSGEQPVSDINITPLTDVMLVLLVVFMISSPVLMAKGMEVHLPQVEDAPSLVEEDHVLYVSADGEIYLDNIQFEIEALGHEFDLLVEVADEENEAVNLFIHADQSVAYGDLTRLMSMATNAGIEQISLVQDVVNGVEAEPGEIAVPETPDDSNSP